MERGLEKRGLVLDALSFGDIDVVKITLSGSVVAAARAVIGSIPYGSLDDLDGFADVVQAMIAAREIKIVPAGDGAERLVPGDRYGAALAAWEAGRAQRFVTLLTGEPEEMILDGLRVYRVLKLTALQEHMTVVPTGGRGASRWYIWRIEGRRPVVLRALGQVYFDLLITLRDNGIVAFEPLGTLIPSVKLKPEGLRALYRLWWLKATAPAQFSAEADKLWS